jgi:hypothetical protein
MACPRRPGHSHLPLHLDTFSTAAHHPMGRQHAAELLEPAEQRHVLWLPVFTLVAITSLIAQNGQCALHGLL